MKLQNIVIFSFTKIKLQSQTSLILPYGLDAVLKKNALFLLKVMYLASLMASGKEHACSAGDTGDADSVPGVEDPLEKEMATHSSILA